MNGPHVERFYLDIAEARADAAERRIAAALALHTRRRAYPETWLCECGQPWNTEVNRCTSPTVTALTPETTDSTPKGT